MLKLSFATLGCPAWTLEQIAENALQKVEEGWKFVRFGVAHEGGNIMEPSQAVRRSIAQFAAVRDAVGDDIEICLDIHTRLDPPDAIALCRALEQYRPGAKGDRSVAQYEQRDAPVE